MTTPNLKYLWSQEGPQVWHSVAERGQYFLEVHGYPIDEAFHWSVRHNTTDLPIISMGKSLTYTRAMEEAELALMEFFQANAPRRTGE